MSAGPEPVVDDLRGHVGVVGFWVMVSRVFGLVREMVLAYFFKAEYGLDAFYAAFRIPNLFRDLLGEGALSKAFIAVLTETEAADGTAAANRLANRVVNAVVVVVGGLVLVGMAATPWIVNLMLPGRGFDIPIPEGAAFGMASKRELTVLLTRVMFPFLLTISLAAVFMGMLNARGRFGIPAAASVFFNVGSVVFGVAGYMVVPRWGLHPGVGMALGVVFGGILQWAVQVPSAVGAGYRFRPETSFRDPRLREVGRLLGPSVIGVAAVQVNVFVNSVFASIGGGWLTWISQAFRLMHLPIGIFGVAVSTVALPAMARALARDDVESYKGCLLRGLKLILAMTVPAAFGLVALDVPIIRLIFERGRFSPHDTQQVASALSCYAIGLAGYASVKVVTDAFYARKDTATPVRVSLASILLNVALNAFLIFGMGFGHRGLALSTACTVTLNAVVLLFLLRRRVGPLGVGVLIRLVVRLGAASVPMALASRGVASWWEGAVGVATTLSRIGQVGLSIAIGMAVFAGSAAVLRIRDVKEAAVTFFGPFRR